MSQHRSRILLSLCAVIFLAAACKKTTSSDQPLPINYVPSIVITSDNYIVYGLDPVTGNKNWEFDGLHGAVYASPVVYNEMLYIIPETQDTIYKLNSKTGALVAKWHFDFGGVKATPIVANGLLYVVSDIGSEVFAIDTGTGKTKWTFTTYDGYPVEASPVLYNGDIYVATLGGWIYCLDASAGGTNTTTSAITPPVWTLTLTGASFHSSPAVAAPYLYIGSITDSNMYCIYLQEPTVPATGTGVERWRYKTQGGIYSSPAAYAGRCIFGSLDFNVYCLDTSINPPTKTVPDLIWKTHTGSQIYSSPYAYNQVVYIGSNDNYLYALNIINGSVKWQYQTYGEVESCPLAYNGTVYIGSYDKNIYAIDSAHGTLKWKYNVNGLIRCSPAIDNLTGAQINSQVSGFTN